MAYTGQIAVRPMEIDGCLQTWQETTDESALLRSKMEDGQTIKTRRRVTAPILNGNASVTVRGSEVEYWKTWYQVNCQNGVLPTKFKFPPDGAEQIWRFSTPPTYEWANADNAACRITFALEKLPQWVD